MIEIQNKFKKLPNMRKQNCIIKFKKIKEQMYFISFREIVLNRVFY